jgi:lipid II isoglutaminyl synthase (glutamine-hydrolysing)
MRKHISIAAGKLTMALARGLTGSGGLAITGLVSARIEPQIVAKLGRGIAGGSILVTGTNGKTTTTKLILDILSSSGKGVVCNTTGSNLYRGVASSLVSASTLAGKINAHYGLFEVDEAAMAQVAPQLQPRVIIVLNLFRDQLDRYGELDTTAATIGRAIAETSADVFLNADDPLVASLGSYVEDKSKLHYFGIEAKYTAGLSHDNTADSIHDQATGKLLVYSQVYFGHLGHYGTKDGKNLRPIPGTVLISFKPEGMGSELVIKLGANSEISTMNLPLPGLYNAYNALAAAAVSSQLSIDGAVIKKSIESIRPAFGRAESLLFNDTEVLLLLVKNPTGFNQIIETYLLQKQQQNILIVINDNYADGRDVSWLWDTAIEDLAGRGHRIIVSGNRRFDMALRLKYGSIEYDSIVDSPEEAINSFISDNNNPILVLPTYTALLEMRKHFGHKLSGKYMVGS